VNCEREEQTKGLTVLPWQSGLLASAVSAVEQLVEAFEEATDDDPFGHVTIVEGECTVTAGTMLEGRADDQAVEEANDAAEQHTKPSPPTAKRIGTAPQSSRGRATNRDPPSQTSPLCSTPRRTSAPRLHRRLLHSAAEVSRSREDPALGLESRRGAGQAGTRHLSHRGPLPQEIHQESPFKTMKYFFTFFFN